MWRSWWNVMQLGSVILQRLSKSMSDWISALEIWFDSDVRQLTTHCSTISNESPTTSPFEKETVCKYLDVTDKQYVFMGVIDLIILTFKLENYFSNVNWLHFHAQIKLFKFGSHPFNTYYCYLDNRRSFRHCLCALARNCRFALLACAICPLALFYSRFCLRAFALRANGRWSLALRCIKILGE